MTTTFTTGTPLPFPGGILNDNNYGFFTPAVATFTGNVGSLTFNCFYTQPTCKYSLAIYADPPTTGSGVLLGNTAIGEGIVTEVPVTANLVSPVAVTMGTTYWVAVITSIDQNFQTIAEDPQTYVSGPFGAFPGVFTWPSPAGARLSGAQNQPFYIGFTEAPGPSPGPPPVAVAVPESLGLWRGQCGINWQGLALVGDMFSNVVGLSDFSIYNEYGNQMRFLVTTPPLHEDRKRIFIPRFEIEVEAGQGNTDGSAPQMMLDYSKDGGKTWSNLQMFRSMGAVGEYIKRLRWINLGQARTWIFRLQYTGSARPVIIGSYWDGYKGLG